MPYCLNYSGTSFCSLKIKITQFPDGFRLNLIILSDHFITAFILICFFYYLFIIICPIRARPAWRAFKGKRGSPALGRLTSGRGGAYSKTQQMFIRGGCGPRSNPLPFYIPFFTKKVTLFLPSFDKWYPFHIPCLGLCIPLNFCKCKVFKIGVNHKNRTFSRLFKTITFICLPFWTLLQTQTTDFPTLLYTLTGEISTLSYSWSLPIQAITGSTPPGLVPSFIYPLQTSAHTLKTRAVKAKTIFLLVVKKVCFKGRDIAWRCNGVPLVSYDYLH